MKQIQIQVQDYDSNCNAIEWTCAVLRPISSLSSYSLYLILIILIILILIVIIMVHEEGG